MDNGKTIGLTMFVTGIILLIIYGIMQDFSAIIETLDIISGAILGLIFLGLIILIISIVIEQKKDTKETMKDIKKEDLKP
jgi:uncharacterized membrane protein YgaE (UPF0421/DUF939 family)